MVCNGDGDRTTMALRCVLYWILRPGDMVLLGSVRSGLGLGWGLAAGACLGWH